MMVQISPWTACVVTFVTLAFGLAIGHGLCLAELRKKFPDLYRTMRTRELEEELASVGNPAHDPK